MKPDISVVIPIYNTEKYLEQCFDSVVNQSLKNIEIICVYEPSEDNSLNIIKNYSDIDSRITVICNPTIMGLSYSRNAGLEKAKGEYVYFLDSDDWIEPYTLERAFERALSTEADAVTFASRVYYDENLKSDSFISTPEIKYSDNYPLAMTGEEAYNMMSLNGEFHPMVWMYLYRTDFLRKANISFCNGCLHEDTLFSTIVFLELDKISVLNEQCHHYRRNVNSLTYSKNIDWKKEFLTYIKLYSELISRSALYENNDFSYNIISGMLSSYISNMKQSYFNISGSDIKNLWNSELRLDEKLLIDSIIDPLLTQLLMGDIKSEVKGFDKIYLYGAGQYARRLYPKLAELGIGIEGVLVSELNGHSMFYEYSVKGAEELKDNLGEDTTIIIGVGQKLRNEVKAKLNELNIKSKVIEI